MLASGILIEVILGHGTYNAVVGDTVGLSPAVHDKGIVEGNNNDLINTLGLDLVDVLGVGRNVGAGAGGGESTRDGDEDDLLVLELCSQKSACEDAVRSSRRVTYPGWRCREREYRK